LKAAYIASKKPSDSDHTTLGVGTKGRKRKLSAGATDTDGNDEEASLLSFRLAIITGYISLISYFSILNLFIVMSPIVRTLELHRPIQLDRLFCIYMVIISRSGAAIPDETQILKTNQNLPVTKTAEVHNTKKVINDYGDSHLFSTVTK